MKLVVFLMLLGLISGIHSQVETASPERFKDYVADTSFQKLDVRTGFEFDFIGHIAGFTNINSESVEFENRSIQTFNKNEPILVTCFSGHRSNKAVDILKSAGFVTIIELKGGVIAWMLAGYKLE